MRTPLLSINDIVKGLGPGHDIDLGANVGDVTEIFLNLDADSVIAVEPLRANYEFIAKRFESDDRVRALHSAVGPTPGVQSLYIKPVGVPDNFGSTGSSLRIDKTNVSCETTEVVDVVTLSSLLQNPVRVLKMDIEGSEYDIMREAIVAGTLQRAQVILYEDHVRKVPLIGLDRPDIIAWLKTHMPDRVFVQIGHEYIRLEDFNESCGDWWMNDSSRKIIEELLKLSATQR